MKFLRRQPTEFTLGDPLTNIQQQQEKNNHENDRDLLFLTGHSTDHNARAHSGAHMQLNAINKIIHGSKQSQTRNIYIYILRWCKPIRWRKESRRRTRISFKCARRMTKQYSNRFFSKGTRGTKGPNAFKMGRYILIKMAYLFDCRYGNDRRLMQVSCGRISVRSAITWVRHRAFRFVLLFVTASHASIQNAAMCFGHLCIYAVVAAAASDDDDDDDNQSNTHPKLKMKTYSFGVFLWHPTRHSLQCVCVVCIFKIPQHTVWGILMHVYNVMFPCDGWTHSNGMGSISFRQQQRVTAPVISVCQMTFSSTISI